MNRYNFVKASRSTVTMKDIATAKRVNEIADILAASALIGEYKFTESAELSAEFAQAISVETEIATRANGSETNRVRVTLPNGKSYLCRAFGAKNTLMPPHKWNTNEIAKICAGFCTSDGEPIEETRQSPTGDILALPVIYVRIA